MAQSRKSVLAGMGTEAQAFCLFPLRPVALTIQVMRGANMYSPPVTQTAPPRNVFTPEPQPLEKQP